jgi:hypothetical protein
MRVLRDGSGDRSLRLPYITRPMWLRAMTNRLMGPLGLCIHCAHFPVGHSPTSSFDGFGGARVFYFLINIIFIIIQYII